MAKVKKSKFIVKKYEHCGERAYAIFRVNEVKYLGDIVKWDQGASPVRGYTGLTKEHADTVKERLDREY